MADRRIRLGTIEALNESACVVIRIHRVWKRVLPIRDRGWGPHELESLVGDTQRKEADR